MLAEPTKVPLSSFAVFSREIFKCSRLAGYSC